MPLYSLTDADLELILPWRNVPAVRRAMYSHHEISLDEHRAWFARLQQDRGRRWYLYRDAADVPQGVVYFTEIDPGQATAFWGFYARPEAPSGTGLRILVDALDVAFGELGLHKLNGEVLADNERSIHLHTKVGFIEEGRFRQQHFDGETRIDVVRLSLLAGEWAEQRPRLAERLGQLDALAAQSPPQNPDPV
jgi:UDP-4-amino-4,6-dideoxy-N-acetyl-beta-L-altrosamine N-acetyltransferase